jgi:hypothetical protein
MLDPELDLRRFFEAGGQGDVHRTAMQDPEFAVDPLVAPFRKECKAVSFFDAKADESCGEAVDLGPCFKVRGWFVTIAGVFQQVGIIPVFFNAIVEKGINGFHVGEGLV